MIIAGKIMKCKYAAVASALALPFVAAAFCAEMREAEANSAPPYWEGTDASGAIVKDENCPVVVEKESLTLNIETLPTGGNVELGEYAAEAIAEYSFYNPTDLNVDMTLLFPFGVFPSYAPEVVNDNSSAISVDGERAECAVRYSYAAYAPFEFNIDKDMARIQDEKRSDPFYAEDTPVTEYRLTLTVPEGKDVSTLKIKLGFNPKKTRMLFPSGSDTWLKVSDGDMYACSYLRKTGEKLVTFYAAGETPHEVAPKVYGGGGKEISVAASVTSAKMTFSEFVFSKRSLELAEVSDTDWYNAFVDMLGEQSGKDGSVDSLYLGEGYLMRWYEYKMSIPAGGRAVNRVRAPLYPTVDGRVNSRYMYTYLLSPAGKWADFQKIDIRINTPYYLSNGSLPFEEVETESGYSYQYTRDSLPQGELTFVLTEKQVESEQDRSKNFLLPSLTWAFVTLSVLAAVAAIVTLIVVFSLRKKKK